MLDKTILYVQCRIHHIHFDELQAIKYVSEETTGLKS